MTDKYKELTLYDMIDCVKYKYDNYAFDYIVEEMLKHGDSAAILERSVLEIIKQDKLLEDDNEEE